MLSLCVEPRGNLRGLMLAGISQKGKKGEGGKRGEKEGGWRKKDARNK